MVEIVRVDPYNTLIILLGVILLVSVLYDLVKKAAIHKIWSIIVIVVGLVMGFFILVLSIEEEFFQHLETRLNIEISGEWSILGMIIIAIAILANTKKLIKIVYKEESELEWEMAYNTVIAGIILTVIFFYQSGERSFYFDKFTLLFFGVIGVGIFVSSIFVLYISAWTYARISTIRKYKNTEVIQSILSTYHDEHVIITKEAYNQTIEIFINLGIFKTLKMNGMNDFSNNDEIKLFVAQSDFEEFFCKSSGAEYSAGNKEDEVGA